MAKSLMVDAYRCGACDALFEQPDGPLWECSRCGSEQLGEDESRCSECRVFMAKVADECCPECQAHEEVGEVTAWRGSDGELYESAAAESERLAGAPERAASRAASETLLERHLAEVRAKALERNARLLPRMLALQELLGERCPRLRQGLTYNIRDIAHDPGSTGIVEGMLFFEELAGLFAPELSEELATARRYELPWEAREPGEEAVRARILARLPKNLTRRMQDGMFSAGSGIGFEMAMAVDGLLEALGWKAGAP